MRLADPPGTARAHTLHVYLPREVEILVKGVAVPVHSLEGRVTGLASHALAPRIVRGLVDDSAIAVTLPFPFLSMCGPDDPGCSLLTATGTVEFARTLGVTIRGHDDCARVCLAIASGHTGPATGCMTALLFFLIVRGHGRGVSSLDGVAGIPRRLLLLPRIAATLGQRCCLPLRLRVAPSFFPCPLSLTSSGCSSACWGPWCSGMRLLGLY